jgi:5-methylcytosine-specific restriction protein A
MHIKGIKRPWENTFKQGATYTDTSFYRTTAWRKLRAYKLQISPYCECPDCVGKYIKADMVDHIQRIQDGGEALDINNLQSMRNHPCHDRKRAREKNAKYNTK